jgi:cation transport ATPase
VVAGLRAARAADAALHRNLRRSLVYNTLAVSAAAAGLVNPLVAALLMPASSAMVVLGSLSVERAVAAARADRPEEAPAPPSSALQQAAK